MSRSPDVGIVAGKAIDTSGKRGRKAQPPNPDDGPVAAFAHELWLLKRRAGDPSFATMRTRLGAAASKSSLAAATRGAALPSWETTWEFVRVLAVDELGSDPEETHREWLARWTAAGAAAGPADALDPAPQDPGAPGPGAPGPAAEAQALGVAAATAGGPAQRKPMFRPTRNQVIAGCAMVFVLVAAGLSALLTPRHAPVPGQSGTTRSDDAVFEGDVTFPDGSVVAPGQTFTKVWQLRNNGSVRWEDRYLTRVNSTPCQAPDMVPIPVTNPGQSVRITVPVTASAAPAHCRIYWKMTDAGQRLLLPNRNPIFLDVVVSEQG